MTSWQYFEMSICKVEDSRSWFNYYSTISKVYSFQNEPKFEYDKIFDAFRVKICHE